MIGRPVGSPLQGPQSQVWQPGAAGKAGLKELGAQVVVVEDELGALEGAEGNGDRPEDVRRITGLDDCEAAGSPGLERQPGRREERVQVLGDEAELAAARRVGPVLVELYRVDDLVRGIAFALRAHDGYPVACRDESLALKPHPPVEGYRKILHDDQDAALHPHKSAGQVSLIRSAPL